MTPAESRAVVLAALLLFTGAALCAAGRHFQTGGTR